MLDKMPVCVLNAALDKFGSTFKYTFSNLLSNIRTFALLQRTAPPGNDDVNAEKLPVKPPLTL